MVVQKDPFCYTIDMIKITEDMMQAERERVYNLLRGPQFDRDQHGSLWDRGTADSYYHRSPRPHWYPNGTGVQPIVTDLSDAERNEYMAGYEWNERFGDKKDWE
jgi:hypothetical protein